MGAAVLLEHRLPDGSVHYDWLIQRGEGGPLVTFRVGVRIDQPGVREFEAERLADHRAAYLEYEGEVSGGRGVVRRVARGELEIVEEGEGEFACEGAWEGRARRRWVGRREEGGWRFR